MKKIVILGCENSHADTFLGFMAKDKKYADVQTVGVYSHDSAATEKLAAKYGVKAMASYDEAVGQVDGVIVTARHGDNHRKYAEPYLCKDLAVFIDKPFTVSEEDALALLRGAKKAGAKVCGGSSCRFDALVQQLRADVIAEAGGKTLGGFVRCPVSLGNPNGGFFFYAQHLVEIVGEIFGRYPKSVRANRYQKSVGATFRYDDFEVAGVYADESYNCYYAVRNAVSADQGGAFTVGADNPCFKKEFDEFYNLLSGGEQISSWNDLAAPVFVLNALDRAMKSGKEEPVGEVSV